MDFTDIFPYGYDQSEANNINTYGPIAVSAAQMYGVPTNLFLAQIYQESSFNPFATSSSSSATGIAQFINGTANEFGLDPTDPVASLYAAAQYDSQLYNGPANGSWANVMQLYGTGTSSANIQSALSELSSGSVGGTQAVSGATPASWLSDATDAVTGAVTGAIGSGANAAGSWLGNATGINRLTDWLSSTAKSIEGGALAFITRFGLGALGGALVLTAVVILGMQSMGSGPTTTIRGGR